MTEVRGGGVSVAAHLAPMFGCMEWNKNVSRIADYALIGLLVVGVVACAHRDAAEGDGRAVVRRGHGESSRPANLAYASTALASDAAAVVDALRLDRLVLVGHSMGGSAAIAYAGANPQRVAGLVLAGAPGKIPPEQADRIIASIEADYDNVMAKYWDELLTNARPDVRARLLRERQSVGKADSIAIIRSLFADDPLPPLGRHPGPTLIIVTDGDDQPVDLHRLLPQLPTARIDGTSHWPHLDKPDAFDAVLDRFLATIR